MSTSDDRKKMQQGLDQEILKEKFIQDLGQKAIVERTIIDGEHMDQLRQVLGDVAADLQRIKAVPEGMKYSGSFSVHVFKSELLRTAAFATVNNLNGCPFDLADAAMRELNGSVKETFGKSRQKLRSGF